MGEQGIQLNDMYLKKITIFLFWKKKVFLFSYLLLIRNRVVFCLCLM